MSVGPPLPSRKHSYSMQVRFPALKWSQLLRFTISRSVAIMWYGSVVTNRGGWGLDAGYLSGINHLIQLPLEKQQIPPESLSSFINTRQQGRNILNIFAHNERARIFMVWISCNSLSTLHLADRSMSSVLYIKQQQIARSIMLSKASSLAQW
jgi:hypothetical protein